MSARTSVLTVAAGLLLAPPALRPDGPFQYHPVSPSRLADTRVSGGAMPNTQDRGFRVQGLCNVPVGAKAVSLNVTSVDSSTPGYLTLYPAGVTRPVVSTVNFKARAGGVPNGAIVPVGDGVTF